jgi:hypothetical protein
MGGGSSLTQLACSFTESNSTCTSCSDKLKGATSTFDGATSINDCVCPAFTYFDAEAGDSGHGECLEYVRERGAAIRCRAAPPSSPYPLCAAAWTCVALSAHFRA